MPATAGCSKQTQAMPSRAVIEGQSSVALHRQMCHTRNNSLIHRDTLDGGPHSVMQHAGR